MALCRVCNIEKNQDLMVKHKTDKICKECNKKYRKSTYQYKTRPWSGKENHKVCRLCSEEKHIDNFSKHKGGRYNVDSICKPCAVIQNNTPENNKIARQWMIDNKELVNKRATERDKEKVKTDIQYRIKKHLRIRMYGAIIKNAKSTRNGKVEDLIGCSIEEYRKHIENQWINEMSWENHGKVWEIDHIIPISVFDMTKTEQQKLAFHYTNVQPLYKSENRSKKNKITI
jgi:hypothetical protein